MKFSNKKIVAILKAVVSGVVGGVALYFGANFSEVAILAYGVARVLFWPDDQESYVFALACMLAAAMLATLSLNSVAENMAINAYYFLIIGSLSSIWQLLTNRRRRVLSKQSYW